MKGFEGFTVLLGARPFIHCPDISERHEVVVRAPADVVFEVADSFDMMTLRPVRAMFHLREALMGAGHPHTPGRHAASSDCETLGWSVLAHYPGLEHVMGTVTQPWHPHAAFEPVPAGHFESYSAPDRVKIVWTVETERLDDELTRLGTETRAVATDRAAFEKFMHYWNRVRLGALAIRWRFLPPIRREAERLWRTRMPGPYREPRVSFPGRRIAPERPIPLPPP